MPRSLHQVSVYLEVGQKRVFAGAIDWPGWCRNGRDEVSALKALYEAGPRYAHVLRNSRLGFQPVTGVSDFLILERLKGNTTTDFGAPDAAPSADATPVNEAELKRLQSILRACWRGLDAAAQDAAGQMLRTGPRGGGRDLEDILRHVQEAEMGYLSRLGWKVDLNDATDRLEQTRQSILHGVKASANGEIPAKGPRGGVRWTARYFVRRDAWHILDHVWEIEDRLEEVE